MVHFTVQKILVCCVTMLQILYIPLCVGYETSKEVVSVNGQKMKNRPTVDVEMSDRKCTIVQRTFQNCPKKFVSGTTHCSLW